MILDTLDNWRLYGAQSAWARAFGFLVSLDPTVEPGEYAIEGRDIYATVFDCTTKALLDTTLEAHRIYADIHAPISGPEVHARFLSAGLQEREPYEAGRDVVLYHHPDRFTALFTLAPGSFTLYLPHEAHLSQGKVDPRPQPLRKVVVKIRAELLRS